MKTPAFWNNRNVTSDLLLPLSFLYGAGAALRHFLTVPETLSVPVICVGNLTAGGGGKTPVALHIGRYLKQKNINAFFLSRGYGGTMMGPLRVDPKTHTARQVGDEPLLLASVLPTVVAKNRRCGARHAVEQGAKAIVMDDGFQNPSIDKTLSFVVIDGTYGLGNGRLLPAGPLREPAASGLSRADTIIILNGNLPVTSAPADLPVLFAKTAAQPSAQVFKGKKVLAFCGLAYPQKFFYTLADAGVVVVETKIFADHYSYSERDIQTLVARAKALDVSLVTTAKDAARLSPDMREHVGVFEITLAFDRPDQLAVLLDHAVNL